MTPVEEIRLRPTGRSGDTEYDATAPPVLLGVFGEMAVPTVNRQRSHAGDGKPQDGQSSGHNRSIPTQFNSFHEQFQIGATAGRLGNAGTQIE